MQCSKTSARLQWLFYHLVGAGEEREWHLKTERLGGLEVDNQLHFRGLLHWQVGRLLALEHAADISSGQAPDLPKGVAIAHEAAGGGERTI